MMFYGVVVDLVLFVVDLGLLVVVLTCLPAATNINVNFITRLFTLI